MPVIYSFIGFCASVAGLAITIMSPEDSVGPFFALGGVIISALSHIMTILERK